MNLNGLDGDEDEDEVAAVVPVRVQCASVLVC